MKLNTATIKFIGMLNDLAKQSKNGIKPFSEFTVEDKQNECLTYDDEKPIEENEEYTTYPLICDMCVEDVVGHHDIINYYKGIIGDMVITGLVYVFKDPDSEPYVLIKDSSESLNVIISDGIWTTDDYGFDD